MSKRRGRNRPARRVGRARAKTLPQGDFFGLSAEAKIVESGVRSIFTPHTPISEASLLFGRQDEVRRLIETLNTPGQHMLLYGERGVGKSSLANVAVDVLLKLVHAGKLFVKRCDQTDTFETMLFEALDSVGKAGALTGLSSTTSVSKDAKIGAGSSGVGANRKVDATQTYSVTQAISPSTAAAALKDISGLQVIDEFDAIQSEGDRHKISELIKQLSDSGSKFKLLVVGIAQTGAQLTAAHPSVQRCLRETKLRIMSDDELREVVTEGSRAIDLTFDSEVISSIVRLSAGYPHFTHLLSLKCAERAIGESRKNITTDDLSGALESAVVDAEGTLKRVYDDSTRSQTSPMYRHILAAAASLDAEEFSSTALRSAIENRTGEEISQYSLNNYFQRLMSRDRATVLRRVAQGIYRFEDPRMRSYVRIVNKMT